MAVSKKPLTFSNVELVVDSPDHGSRMALSCVCEGARYHIWILPDAIGNGVRFHGELYKRSMAERGEPGYYEPRKLDCDKPRNVEIINAMRGYAFANDLYAKGLRRLELERELAAKEREAEAALERMRNHAPDLLAALRKCRDAMAHTNGDPLARDRAIDAANIAIDLACKEGA